MVAEYSPKDILAKGKETIDETISGINEADAVIVSCEESRKVLSSIGISGEIV